MSDRAACAALGFTVAWSALWAAYALHTRGDVAGAAANGAIAVVAAVVVALRVYR